MSGPQEDVERPHEPTPRKLDKARRKGDIAKSADLNAAAGYAGLLIVLGGAGAAGVGQFGSGLMMMLDRPAELASGVFAQGGSAALTGLIARTLMAALPWVAVPAAAVLLTITVQRGFVFAPDKLQPKMSRISPVSNARNKYGRSGLFEFLKSFVKLLLYSACLALFLWARREAMANVTAVEPTVGITMLGRLAMEFLSLVVLIALILGGVDWLWQYVEHRRRNRMSDQEIRDEVKESDGDPQMKQERRFRAQEIAQSQMISAVTKADVVIVNPTHFAVALSWSRTPGSAPIVVAKGVDEMARRIRTAALEARVPIHSDPPTARALFNGAAIGQEVDPAHYRAVAAAIRFADQLRQRRRTQGFG